MEIFITERSKPQKILKNKTKKISPILSPLHNTIVNNFYVGNYTDVSSHLNKITKKTIKNIEDN